MSDDAAVAATNIPMEDPDGAATPLPPELTPTPPADVPPEIVRVDTPAPEPDPADLERQGILANLGRERQENRSLKQFRDQAAPLLLAFQKHPDLLAEIQARESGQRAAPAPAPRAAAPPPPVDDAPTDDEVEQYARDMVLYKPDGSGLPDVDAAKRILASNHRQVERAVAQAIRTHVAPIQQTIHRTQGQSAKDAIIQAAKTVGADGPDLDRMLDGFLESDPSLLQNPQIGVAAIMMARGMKGLPENPAFAGMAAPAAAPGAPAAPPPAPVFTERPGARTPVPVTLSPIEARTARARGMTPEAWGAATAPLTTAKPGQHHIILEND
jgi:hypothetical protein